VTERAGRARPTSSLGGAATMSAPPRPCVFAFDGGLSYDLSSLADYSSQARSPKGLPFLANNSDATDPLTYAFAFCSDLNYGVRCGLSASFSLRAGVGCVRNFGTSAPATAAAAPLTERRTDGLSLTYGGGTSACGGQFGQGATTTFHIACASLAGAAGGAAAQLVAVDSLAVADNNCRLTYELRSPAGCGLVTPTVSDPVRTFALVFAGVIGALALYLAGGIAYKRRALGARGLEAVPHIDFWRRCWSACGAWRRGGVDYRRAGEGGEDGAIDVDYALYSEEPAPAPAAPPAPAAGKR
jgi:hypothetical protein